VINSEIDRASDSDDAARHADLIRGRKEITLRGNSRGGGEGPGNPALSRAMSNLRPREHLNSKSASRGASPFASANSVIDIRLRCSRQIREMKPRFRGQRELARTASRARGGIGLSRRRTDIRKKSRASDSGEFLRSRAFKPDSRARISAEEISLSRDSISFAASKSWFEFLSVGDPFVPCSIPVERVVKILLPRLACARGAHATMWPLSYGK